MFGVGPNLAKRMFGLPRSEITFAARGFKCSESAVQQHLEHIGEVFLYGYHAALSERNLENLKHLLKFVESKSIGFAFEGAAMGLALLDSILPWGKWRVDRFICGPGRDHVYMAHAGVGWAFARRGYSLTHTLKHLDRFDPLIRWLVVDGYGFSAGYFDWPRYISSPPPGRSAAGYLGRAFDQGLGRSLWFVEGADTREIAQTIERFHESRRADLWSGVGLACAYAGGVDRSSVNELLRVAVPYKAQLAQGAAFAAKARTLAHIETEHTEMACDVLCGLTAGAAASLTDEALEGLPGDGAEPAYEEWRRRIQSRF